MYMRIGENLGQPIKPIPPGAAISQQSSALKAAVNVFCRRPPTHFAERELPVPFRENFNDFLREVQRAVGRWTVFRSDPGHARVKGLVQPWKDHLKTFHQSKLNAKVAPGTLLKIRTLFMYRGVGTASERVCGILIVTKEKTPLPTTSPSIDQCRKETIRGIKGFLVCKKPCVPRFPQGGFDWVLVDSSSPNQCTYSRILTSG